MRVRDLMTRKVFTVRADKKLIVGDAQNRLVGLISHRDLMRASISAVETRIAKLERSQHE